MISKKKDNIPWNDVNSNENIARNHVNFTKNISWNDVNSRENNC